MKIFYLLVLFLHLSLSFAFADSSENLGGELDGFSLVAIFIIAYLVLVIMTFVCARKKVIVVYKNIKDVWLCFGVVMAFIFGIPSIMALGSYIIDNKSAEVGVWVLVIVIALVLLGLLLTSLFITLRSNNYNPVKFILALITKYPIALFWGIGCWNAIAPSGDTAAERRKSRSKGMLMAAVLGYLIYALIAEEEQTEKTKSNLTKPKI